MTIITLAYANESKKWCQNNVLLLRFILNLIKKLFSVKNYLN